MNNRKKMKMLLGAIVGSVFLAASFSGCAGNGVQAPGSDRGDGSIPIGRTIGPGRTSTKVTMTFSDGSVKTTTPDTDGTVYVDAAPAGPATLEFDSTDERYMDSTYQTVIGSWSTMIFNVRIQQANTDAQIESLEFKNSNPLRIKLGEKIKLKVKVNGTRLGALEPSLIEWYGLGTIDANDFFQAEHIGAGQIKAELLGKTTTLDVIVEE